MCLTKTPLLVPPCFSATVPELSSSFNVQWTYCIGELSFQKAEEGVWGGDPPPSVVELPFQLNWKLQLQHPNRQLKRRGIYRKSALILCENGRFRSVDLLYWIAVLFWGWRVILLQRGGLRWGRRVAVYIEQIIGSFYLLHDEGTLPTVPTHALARATRNQPPTLPMPSPPATQPALRRNSHTTISCIPAATSTAPRLF